MLQRASGDQLLPHWSSAVLDSYQQGAGEMIFLLSEG